MSLFTAKDYQEFIKKFEPRPEYIERVNKEAKDMVKLWVEAQGEQMFRMFWQIISQERIDPEDIHLPTQTELKAIFAAFLDCQNRAAAMMKRLTKGVK